MAHSRLLDSAVIILAVILWGGVPNSAARAQSIVFSEDFEFGQGGWSASGGVWQVGQPTTGLNAHGGQYCAGTNLGGNYPAYTSARLQSPPISLPAVNPGETLQLKFWSWIRTHLDTYRGADEGFVQIDDSGWANVSAQQRAESPIWTQGGVDLTAYAGKTIRIGFNFASGGPDTWGHSTEDLGWYIDDISIVKAVPNFRNPENFENGMGDWSVSNGTWQVGAPTYGPASTPSGSSCMATHLHGNYWAYAYTSLVSPPVTLNPKTPGGMIELRFKHWFNFHGDTYRGRDQGILKLSVVGGSTTTLASYINNSAGWTLGAADLTSYSGSTVIITFYFESGGRDTWGHSTEAPGWYIDNLEIVGIDGHCEVGFQEFGNGLPGTGGITPKLAGNNVSCIGSFVLRITDGLGGTGGLLWFGTQQTNLPILGGEFYIDLSGIWTFANFTLFGSPGVGGAGYFTFPGVDVSPFVGIPLTMQATLIDPGAVQGVSITKGLHMVIG